MIIDKIFTKATLKRLLWIAQKAGKQYVDEEDAQVIYTILDALGHGKPFEPDAVTESLAPVDCDRCSAVAEVQATLDNRERKGLVKYGTTVGARTDLTPAEWCQHAIEELLDGAVYLTKLKREVEK